jgi:ribosome-binding protein aMBF1 (putative translation factor)
MEAIMLDGSCQTDGRKSRISKIRLTELFHEHGVDIPSGVAILHLCDNPPCGNWNHLMLGTKSENSKQAYDKNRQKNCFESGEKHPNRKLSARDVEAIVRVRREGMSQYKIAEEYHVNQSQISRILSGKRWKTVTGV